MGMLDGKVALVTGAARGQGLAHARALAMEGADVAIVDICGQLDTVPYEMSSIDDLEVAHKELERYGTRVWSRAADMRDDEQVAGIVQGVVDELGAVDVAVVNHGIWSRGDFWTMPNEVWQDMLDVNLTSVWKTLKAVAPVMIEHGSGSIVLTSSVMGVKGQAGSAHYTAAKHGVLGLMKAVGIELAPFGVRVNAVLPGFVDTAMTDWQGCYDMTSGKEGSTRADHEKSSRHWHAIGGLIEPGEVSGAVVFLASDASCRITGTEIPVDAGHLILPAYNHSPA